MYLKSGNMNNKFHLILKINALCVYYFCQTAFNPGEMTGRSTGAEEVKPMIDLGSTRTFEDLGRHSSVLEITNKMDKQTSEVNDIMRHSIATNYSFHSKVSILYSLNISKHRIR